MWDGGETFTLTRTSRIRNGGIVAAVKLKEGDILSAGTAWDGDGGCVAGRCVDIKGTRDGGKGGDAGRQVCVAG